MNTGSSSCKIRWTLMAVAIAMLFWMMSPVSAMAGEEAALPEKPVVGAMLFPPFAMKTPTGEWEGLSIDLWYAAARNLETDFELREFSSIIQIKQAVATGEIDLMPVAAVKESLELIMDFSTPYYRSGSAIAVPIEADGYTLFHVAQRLLKRLFSWNFLKVVGVLILVWLLAGTLVWLFENRKNLEMFDQRVVKGLGNGIWWAAVTMTTVGYGDKAPKTMGGRVVAIVWMFASIVLISSFTAAITTSLTVGELRGKVRGFYDLPNVRVGTLTDGPTAEYLGNNGIVARPSKSIRDGLQAVAEKRLDAFVHDEAILKHLVNTQFPDRLHVLSGSFNHYYVGMALPPSSKLREPLNRAMLKVMETDKWEKLQKQYFGSGG